IIAHLQAAGLHLKVIPARQDCVYLTLNQEATRESFQSKSRMIEFMDEWEGAIIIEREPEDESWSQDVSQWGCCGCRINKFLIFGDPGLVKRVSELSRSRECRDREDNPSACSPQRRTRQSFAG